MHVLLLVVPDKCANIYLFLVVYRSDSGIGSLAFSETQHGVRGPRGALRDGQSFWKKIASKIGQKYSFLNLLENVVIIFF